MKQHKLEKQNKKSFWEKMKCTNIFVEIHQGKLLIYSNAFSSKL